ncbi:hypothetical protein EVG20_g8220 [Dentipellis fragilis]|uniref:Uncharacterized protein n=1 Tax=Dentipellis fragilis TaxID=205917 RepID=A0A4Y9Y885_9AGAM|nr:hypothetical protein EVG20_g8220 [Dentipellis fragilis]
MPPRIAAPTVVQPRPADGCTIPPAAGQRHGNIRAHLQRTPAADVVHREGGAHGVATRHLRVPLPWGRGAWSQFLTIASDWVDATLQNFRDVAELLLTCTDSQRVHHQDDVLVRHTRGDMQPPRLLIFYCLLWGRQSVHIDGFPPHPHLSMLAVMGCANANAEIATLACRKERHTCAGTLSVPSLVERGRAIEGQHLALYDFPVQPHAPFDVPLPYAQDKIGMRRRLISNIFRAAAKVYLHNVLSGHHPGRPEIKGGHRGDDPVPQERARGEELAIELGATQRRIWGLPMRTGASRMTERTCYTSIDQLYSPMFRGFKYPQLAFNFQSDTYNCVHGLLVPSPGSAINHVPPLANSLLRAQTSLGAPLRSKRCLLTVQPT